MNSFTGKVQIVLGILFLVILIVLGAAFYILMEKNMIRQRHQEMANSTELIHRMASTYANQSIRNYLRALSEKTRDLAVYYYQNYDASEGRMSLAYRYFKEVMLDKNFGKIGYTGYLAGVDSNAINMIHPAIEPGVDLGRSEIIREASRMKEGFFSYMWQNPGEISQREKVAYLTYFKPWDLVIWASSYKNEFYSLVSLDVLEENIGPLTFGEGGYAFVMDREGEMLIHPAGNGAFILDRADAAGRKFVWEMIEKGEGNMRLLLKDPHAWGRNVDVDADTDLPLPGSGEAEEYLLYYKSLPEMNWIIGTLLPISPMYDFLGRIRLLTIGAILIGGMIIFLFISLLFRRMLRPISRMKRVSDAVSRGDLSGRIEVTGDDEISVISRQFNTVLDDFEGILEKIHTAAAILVDSLHDLTASSQEIESTSNEQAASVKEIVSTMEDSDQLAKGIASRINEVASIAKNTQKAVADGVVLVDQSRGKMEEIKSANAERIAGVKMLNDRVENIWEIITLINFIADQTRIIAFNAELEASTAGSAGKSFRIVASEIRRLVDNTVASTGEIRTRIDEIQHASDRLILASEEATERIVEGWELSQDVGRVFEDILSSAEISAGSANHIALSIQQQVSAFEQILLTLKQISEGIDNFVLSTRSSTETCQRLEETANRLNRMIKGYGIGKGKKEVLEKK